MSCCWDCFSWLKVLQYIEVLSRVFLADSLLCKVIHHHFTRHTMSSHWATSLVATALKVCYLFDKQQHGPPRKVLRKSLGITNGFSPDVFQKSRNLRFFSRMEFWTSCSCCCFSCFLFPLAPKNNGTRSLLFADRDQRVMDGWMHLAPCCSWLGMDLSNIFVPICFTSFGKVYAVHIVFVQAYFHGSTFTSSLATRHPIRCEFTRWIPFGFLDVFSVSTQPNNVWQFKNSNTNMRNEEEVLTIRMIVTLY